MSKKKRTTLAEQLIAAVRASDLSMTAIADRCGMSQPTLTRFVNGQRDLTLTTADKLTAFFSMRLTKAVQPTS